MEVLSGVDDVGPRLFTADLEKFSRVEIDVVNWIVGWVEILDGGCAATTSHLGDDALLVVNVGRLGP